MKRARFTYEQIIGILTEHEASAKCADLCCKHGMWEAAFYNWKAKFGGMTVSDAKLVNGCHRHEAQSNADNHHHTVCGLFGRIKRVTILNFIKKARRSGGDEGIRTLETLPGLLP